MESHKPECPSLNECAIEGCFCPKPQCICAEIKRAEKRAYAAATDAVVTAAQEFLDALKLAP